MDGTHLPDPEQSSLVALARSIHAASIDPQAWPAALEGMRLRLGASVVTIGHHDFGSGAESALFEAPLDTDLCVQMAAFSARNPWFLSSEDYVAGRVVAGDDLISPRDLRRTDFYRDFLQPRGLLHRLCGVVSRDRQGMHFLCALRSECERGFGEGERSDLQQMLAHVALSLESQWRWQEAADMSHALLELSDGESQALMLVTAEARLVHRNRVAGQLLQGPGGLALEDHTLRAGNPAEQRLLREAISRACGDPASADQPQVLSLAGAAGGAPLVVVVRRTGPVFQRGASGRRPLALLSVRCGSAAHDAARCVFARHYELTLAQARVSSLIYGGRSLAAIAASLHVSENTVRSHLKQIFQKTGTHSQMDLVHLHARICPGWT